MWNRHTVVVVYQLLFGGIDVKIGVNQWCFPADFTLEQCFQAAAGAGFDGLELNVTEGPGDGADQGVNKTGLTLDTTSTDLSYVKELAGKYGLELPSVSTGLHWKYSLTSNDPSQREKGQQIVVKMLEIAKGLGADTVLVVPGVVKTDVSYKTAYDRALHVFRDLAQEAEKYQVNIGVENVWNKFLLSPLEMRRFIDSIGSQWVGAYFDAGNVLVSGFAHHWVEALGHCIKKVHVKDFRCEIGSIQGFTSLFNGDMDWVQLVKSLREVGYDSYLTAELSPYRFAPQQLIGDTAEKLKMVVSL